MCLGSVVPLLLVPVALNAGWSDHAPVAINLSASPGQPNAHGNSGGRRIVRIDTTSIALCPHGYTDRTYRSMNDGGDWDEIDTDGTYSGCLASGPDSMVYHFYRSDDNIYMVRFRFDADPPAPVLIHTGAGVSETQVGVYRAINATVDSAGALYVACHWGNPDRLYVLRSSNGGDSWEGPWQISSDNARIWFYPHLEATPGGEIVCVYREWTGDDQMVFGRSADRGETWNSVVVSSEATYNPSLLTVTDDSLFIFAQSSVSAHTGLVYNLSVDGGGTWLGWRLIEETCGYADPSPGLGEDGVIYVAYRSSLNTGVTSGSCGDQSMQRKVRGCLLDRFPVELLALQLCLECRQGVLPSW
jgi:hypothetical protein